jgi:hypothetical protein
MQNRRKHFFWLLVFILSLTPNVSWPRWESPEEAAATYLTDTAHLDVAADGTFVNFQHKVLRIERESAVSDYGTIELNYNASIENMEIVSASVTNGKDKRPVSKKYIEHRSAQGSDSGFNSKKVLVIAFPEVRIGSVIEYKVKIKRHKPVLKGLFQFLASPFDSHVKKGRMLTVRSEVPLYYHIDGPLNSIRASELKKGPKHEYQFDLLKDAYFRKASKTEPDSWSAEPFFPVVQITSARSWSKLAADLTKMLEPSFSAVMPARFAKFVEVAKSEAGFVRRADSLVTQMIKQLRYMGDWRESENLYVPRGYNEIDRTSFGDCKDFSLLLAGMLRALGYKADVVLVERGETPYFPIMPIPRTNYFDHMIVRAEDEAGQVYWLDPTNSAANARGAWRDIAGRPVLVLAAGTTQLERIPDLQPEDSQMSSEIIEDLSSPSDVKTSVQMTFVGAIAAELLGGLRVKGDKNLSRIVLSTLARGDDYKEEQTSVDIKDEYVAEPIGITASARVSRIPTRSTAGVGHPLSSLFEKHSTFPVMDRVLGAEIGKIGKLTTKVRLKGISLVGELPVNCEIESRWISGWQRYSKTADGVLIETVEITKKNLYSIEELKSAEFEDLKRKIRKCHEMRLLIFKPL